MLGCRVMFRRNIRPQACKFLRHHRCRRPARDRHVRVPSEPFRPIRTPEGCWNSLLTTRDLFAPPHKHRASRAGLLVCRWAQQAPFARPTWLCRGCRGGCSARFALRSHHNGLLHRHQAASLRPRRFDHVVLEQSQEMEEARMWKSRKTRSRTATPNMSMLDRRGCEA